MKLAIAFLAATTIAAGVTRVPSNTPPVVTVRAHDFAFEGPKTVKPGATTFRLINNGKELHHLTLLKLAKGKTFKDFADAMKVPGPPPKWITGFGGPNPATPGSTAEATLSLEPGEYVMICFVPSPGESAPHAAKGMVRPLTVSEGSERTPMPHGDVTIKLTDYSFGLSKPLTAGKHVINVENDAAQPHEIVLVKLKPGKKAMDFMTFVEKDLMKSVPPGMPIGGIGFIDKGHPATFPVNLAAGTYALICFVPDAKDGKTHAEHGMLTQFEVK